MTRVYSTPDPSVAHLVQNALEEHGIDAVVRGERRGALAGELAWTDTWAEVWVGDAARAAEALALVADATAAPEAGPGWRCAVCGEDVEGAFEACWNCGADRPA